MSNLSWPPIIAVADTLTRGETARLGQPPTLRRIHYLLVAGQVHGYLNNRYCYKRLSDLTAKMRDAGTFPPLADRTRSVSEPEAFDGPDDALAALVGWYRRDRWAGQQRQVVIGCEKAGLVPLLEQTFHPLGLPVVSLGGFTSQPLLAELRDLINGDGRPVTVLYGGDYDPSGLDIERDAQRRLGFALKRVALTWAQVQRYGLPEALPKPGDTRTARMLASQGRATQVEVDALDPTVLVNLYLSRVRRVMDQAIYDAVLTQEEADRAYLRSLINPNNPKGGNTP